MDAGANTSTEKTNTCARKHISTDKDICASINTRKHTQTQNVHKHANTDTHINNHNKQPQRIPPRTVLGR